MPCGVGDYTASLASELSRRCEVGLLTTQTTPDMLCTDWLAQVWSVRSWKLSESIKLIAKLQEIIKSWRPDVIHIQFPTRGYDGNAFALLPRAAKFFGHAKAVLTLHEPLPPHRVNDWLLLRGVDALLVTRDDILSDYREQRRRERRSFDWVVPIGSSIPRIARLLPTATAREHHRRKLVFFGFIEPKKGLEDLLALADPVGHDLFIIGGVAAPDYHQRLRAQAALAPWEGRVVFTGELPAAEVSAHLASADAVVLPFKNGAHAGNSSLVAARVHGVFVVTTSTQIRGYRELDNVYFAHPGDVAEMRAALQRYAGVRVPGSEDRVPSWADIADRHQEIYAALGRSV